jgi:aminoglycoside 3-N-acetyltransferase
MKLKKMLQYVDYFGPSFLIRPLRKHYEKRTVNRIKERFRKITITKEEITSIINNLNLDCDVFLHSSTTNIGRISGGTKFVCELIQNKVNIEKHTLLVSALPYRGKFKAYLESNPVFDVRTAPVAMGAINEYFSLYPNAKRSLHPTHSVVAIGPDAEYYVSEHHLDNTPFGVHSPYYRILEKQGKIVLFGVGLRSMTFSHVIEDILGNYFPVNPYCKKEYQVPVFDNEGKEYIVKTPCHDPLKALKRNGYNLMPYFQKYNAIKTYLIGDSEISVLEAQLIIYAHCQALLEGMSLYGKFKIKAELKEKVLKLKNIISWN